MAEVILYLDTDHQNDTGIMMVSNNADALKIAYNVAHTAHQKEVFKVQGNYPGKAKVRWLDGTKPEVEYTARVFLNSKHEASEFILVLKERIGQEFKDSENTVTIDDKG